MPAQLYNIDQLLEKNYAKKQNKRNKSYRCIMMVKALNSDNTVKTFTSIIDPTVNWHEGRINVESTMAGLHRMCSDDSDVIAYQGATFSLQDNGLYKQSAAYYPEVKGVRFNPEW